MNILLFLHSYCARNEPTDARSHIKINVGQISSIFLFDDYSNNSLVHFIVRTQKRILIENSMVFHI